MKLIICWSTNGSDHHDCHKAHQALFNAGHGLDIINARARSTYPRSFSSRSAVNPSQDRIVLLTGAGAG